MRRILPLLLFLCVAISANTQSTRDLPSPRANLQTLAAGSYVIPMDNNLQANAAGYFNLKTYGLIIHLLNNGIKVKWAIKAGKTKDGTDFSGTATRLLPTTTAIPSIYNFLAGPFVISAADTTGVAAIVQSFYMNNGLTGNNRPAVFKLTFASTNVDIRYDLTGFIPKAAILNDGVNTAIHIGYMTKASIPARNYEIASAVDLVSRCYTFASEPHIDGASMNVSYVEAVHIFTKYGGNFLAQCDAIESYENHASGRFHSTAGITKVNATVSSTETLYPNADLSYTQYHGVFNIRQEGSVRNWVLGTGSFYRNNAHNHATGASNTPVGASVAKMNAASLAGGLVFYLGNHDFTSTSVIESINGIRMYMNAYLTPTSINRSCTLGTYLMAILSLKLKEFNAQQKGTEAELTWTTAQNSTASKFIIERSNDGTTFREVGMVFSKTGREEAIAYKFNEPVAAINGTNLYYRIRTEDNSGKYEYSETRVLKISGINSSATVTTFPNPFVSKVIVVLPAGWNSKPINYELLDLNGKCHTRFSGTVNSRVLELNVDHLTSGYYYLRLNCNGEQISKRILKK